MPDLIACLLVGSVDEAGITTESSDEAGAQAAAQAFAGPQAGNLAPASSASFSPSASPREEMAPTSRDVRYCVIGYR
jgi:hypothetical protein